RARSVRNSEISPRRRRSRTNSRPVLHETIVLSTSKKAPTRDMGSGESIINVRMAALRLPPISRRDHDDLMEELPVGTARRAAEPGAGAWAVREANPHLTPFF